MSSGGFDDQPRQQGWPGPGAPGQQYGQPGPQGWPGPGTPGQYDQPGWPAGGGPGYPYGQPGGNWAAASRRTNSLAIAALCCGIAQVIAGPFAGIPAIILGSMSLKQIGQTGEDGRGLAITGLVLGIVGTLLTVIGIIVFVVAWQHISSQNGY